MSPVLCWTTYDPTWLVKLAKKYTKDFPWLPSAFQKCTQARYESEFYTHFVDPDGPEWKFKENIILVHPKEGDIVVDILKRNRIGGIEYLTRLTKS